MVAGVADLMRAEATRGNRRLWAFVLSVGACGSGALALAFGALGRTPLDPWTFVLSALMLGTGRFAIKVPGRAATVSVSEFFLFTSLILFGPAPATLTVAVDGLWASITHRDRRWYRALFNVAEPAFSTLAAGVAFALVAGIPVLGGAPVHPSSYLLPALAMAATYFLLNSLLQAIAVAIESGESVFAVWGQHALYLGINYYAAASLATIAVENASTVNLEVIGLVVPLLVLSYAAYKAAASRIEDADKHIDEVQRLYQATVETLAIAVDAKDQVTHGHIRRVQRHTLALARALGMTDDVELKALEASSLLHDVGKLAVPDYVLNKPGSLTQAEFDRIKLHAAKGAEILTAVGFPYPVVPIVRHHHEQWDGRGYPDGLSGDNIPLGARILTVVDCFDALTSDRPYRRRMPDEDATAILQERSGTMYDPRVVDVFITLLPSLRRTDAMHGENLTDAEASTAAPASRRSRPNDPSETKSVGLSHFGAEAAISLATSIAGAELCLVSPDPGGDVLRVTYATSRIARVTATLQLRTGEGLAGWVAANRHTIGNSDAALDLGDAARRLDLRYCTATPVFLCGALAAVMCVYSADRCSPEHLRFIGALAQEIGVAITRHEQRHAGSSPAAMLVAPSERPSTQREHRSRRTA